MSVSSLLVWGLLIMMMASFQLVSSLAIGFQAPHRCIRTRKMMMITKTMTAVVMMVQRLTSILHRFSVSSGGNAVGDCCCSCCCCLWLGIDHSCLCRCYRSVGYDGDTNQFLTSYRSSPVLLTQFSGFEDVIPIPPWRSPLIYSPSTHLITINLTVKK